MALGVRAASRFSILFMAEVKLNRQREAGGVAPEVFEGVVGALLLVENVDYYV